MYYNLIIFDINKLRCEFIFILLGKIYVLWYVFTLFMIIKSNKIIIIIMKLNINNFLNLL